MNKLFISLIILLTLVGCTSLQKYPADWDKFDRDYNNVSMYNADTLHKLNWSPVHLTTFNQNLSSCTMAYHTNRFKDSLNNLELYKDQITLLSAHGEISQVKAYKLLLQLNILKQDILQAANG